MGPRRIERPPVTEKLQHAVIARANSAPTDPIPSDYEPPPTVRQIAAALATSAADTWTALAEQAGVSRSTVQRALSDPAAVKWIAQEGTRLSQEALGAVHFTLLQKALTSNNPAFLRLYMLRFDEAFRNTEIASRGKLTQNNIYESMSPAELEKHVRREIRKLGLAVPAPDAGENR